MILAELRPLNDIFNIVIIICVLSFHICVMMPADGDINFRPKTESEQKQLDVTHNCVRVKVFKDYFMMRCYFLWYVLSLRLTQKIIPTLPTMTFTLSSNSITVRGMCVYANVGR